MVPVQKKRRKLIRVISLRLIKWVNIKIEMFWLFFNSEMLSSHPTNSIPQQELGNGDFGWKIIIFAKNRQKMRKAHKILFLEINLPNKM